MAALATMVEDAVEPALAASSVAIHRLLLEVEDVSPEDVGAIVVERGAVREGAILVEDGRVCWAAAAHMPRRLINLLLERAEGLDQETLRHAFHRCRLQKSPLGECLVQEGLITPGGLRSALLDHTVDALAALTRLPNVSRRWISREERSYDARFTFSTLELATSAAAREYPAAAARGRDTLAETLPGGVQGASLFRGGSEARPVTVAHLGADGLGVGGVASLADWAVSTLDLSNAFAPGSDFVVSVISNGDGWVGFRLGEFVHVAVCHRPEQLAAVLGRLRRR